MGRKTLIRVLAIAAIAAAVTMPLAAYGAGWGNQGGERRVEAVVALGTAFSFQGSLADGGSPATGTYDFEFQLWDALAGGAQVGATQTVGDVAVSGGLFTVTLNFGDVFHGDQHFLEIHVRAGASAGAYTTLTPRQPLNAVPNASYAREAGSANGLQGTDVSVNPPLAGDILRFDGARWAPSAAGGGGLSLPFAASLSSGSQLLSITNSGTGSGSAAIHGKTNSTAGSVSAVIGEVTSATAGGFSAGVRGINMGTGGSGIGVWGTQEGSGWGVYGETPSGIGVYGSSAGGTGVFGGSTGGTAGLFSSSGGTAIEIQGKIAVGGSAPAAFVHTVTAQTCAGQCSIIDNPATNGFPNAIVLVTQRWEGIYNVNHVGVYYNAGKWIIFNEDTTTDIPVGSKYNVLVIHP